MVTIDEKVDWNNEGELKKFLWKNFHEKALKTIQSKRYQVINKLTGPALSAQLYHLGVHKKSVQSCSTNKMKRDMLTNILNKTELSETESSDEDDNEEEEKVEEVEN